MNYSEKRTVLYDGEGQKFGMSTVDVKMVRESLFGEVMIELTLKW